VATSLEHERLKTLLARMVEVYALELDLPLNGYGQATFKRKLRKAGLEPDECYVFGRTLSKRSQPPDLAVEIIVHHGGIDRLAIYARLGVAEVWFWKEGRLELYGLNRGTYRRLRRSRFLPDLDLSLLTHLLAGNTRGQTEAVRTFRERLRARRSH
jgi:Uma2 family endonuclease